MSDNLIINRNGVIYEVSTDSTGALEDTDLLLVNRNGVTYTVTGDQISKFGNGPLGSALPPFTSQSGPSMTLTNTDGKVEFSLNGTTWSSSLTVPAETIYYCTWTNDILSAAHNSNYETKITVNYPNLGSSQDVEIKMRIDKLPDPFVFTDVVDVNPLSLNTSNTISPLETINAPTSVWGSSDAVNAQIAIGGNSFQSIPSAPGSLYANRNTRIRVRHNTGSTALTDYSTTLNIGYGTGAGEFETDVYKSTNINSFVNKPSITSPTASQVVGSLTPTLTGNGFTSVGNLVHGSTDWQIASDSAFNSIVWESLSNSSNLTSITTSTLSVASLYVRVRYRDNLGAVSLWSDVVAFSTPFGSTDSNSSLTSFTNMEINASTTVTLQPGTYRVSLWGAGGGGGANGAAGGAGGSVRKDVTYSAQTSISFTIGGAGQGGRGGCQDGTCPSTGAVGGSPGGGNGATGDWRGGSGGGYSSALSMIAGGGGGGSPGGGYATGGGQDPNTGSNTGGYGARGCQGPGGRSGVGVAGSGGGGGGAGAHETSNTEYSCQSGNGGNNSGSYDTSFAANGTTPGNSYTSTAFSRTFGASGGNGGARIQRIGTQFVPVLSFTNNLASTATTDAGNSINFTVAASDSANTDTTLSYQWYRKPQGSSSFSVISGATSATLTRYSQAYYSDNGDTIKCRASASNSVGSSFADSNELVLTVNRQYDCNGAQITGSTVISGDGFKPDPHGTTPSADVSWGSWSPGFNDICSIDAQTRSWNAGGRCGFCDNAQGQPQGFDMRLELQIIRSDGTAKHWGDTSNGSNNCGKNAASYQANANGGGWDPDTDGTPTFRLMCMASGTSCRGGVGNTIFPDSNAVTIDYQYKRRNYLSDTRP